MANLRTAGKNFHFLYELGKLDERLRVFLTKHDMDQVLNFANFFEHVPATDDALKEARALAEAAGAGPDVEEWSKAIDALHNTAVVVSSGVAARIASVDSFHLSADLAEFRSSDATRREDEVLRTLRASNLSALPSEWRGKRYRREQLATTEQARATAEEKERLRWGRELAGLLLEAKLPFASAAGAAAEDGHLRCCRGVRASTIQQRISCWRPFRRWLTLQSRSPWPAMAQDLLDYFEVRKSEKAPRTAYSSLLSSLRFLEEAGEVPEAERLCKAPALANAVAELALTTAHLGKGAREKGQAPQLPLVLVADLELVVLDRSLPLFQRAFAAFRLFRHWASLRWDDTQGLAPHPRAQGSRCRRSARAHKDVGPRQAAPGAALLRVPRLLAAGEVAGRRGRAAHCWALRLPSGLLAATALGQPARGHPQASPVLRLCGLLAEPLGLSAHGDRGRAPSRSSRAFSV